MSRPFQSFALSVTTLTAVLMCAPESAAAGQPERLSVRMGEGTRVDFRVRLQVDGTDGEFDLATRRVGLDGEILNLFDYQVERELGDEKDPWRDVYLNYKQFRVAEVQAGKFKLPFSLDENTSPVNLDFVYRSRAATLLAPGRDRGVMAHGRITAGARVNYEIGVFANDGRNARRNDSDGVHGARTVAGRLTVQPFRSSSSVLSDLEAGLAFTTSDVPEGVSDIRGRTAFGQSFYQPGFWVNGERRRLGFELRWRPGPFSLKSEYMRLTDERRGLSVEEGDLSSFHSTGWYVSGTWMLTGERRTSSPVNPKRPLFQGGFGAVEVAARVEGIRFGSATDGIEPSLSPRADVVPYNSHRVNTVGVNWYVNRWVKVQVNLSRETIADPLQGPASMQPDFWSRAVRFQFSM